MRMPSAAAKTSFIGSATMPGMLLLTGCGAGDSRAPATGRCLAGPGLRRQGRRSSYLWKCHTFASFLLAWPSSEPRHDRRKLTLIYRGIECDITEAELTKCLCPATVDVSRSELDNSVPLQPDASCTRCTRCYCLWCLPASIPGRQCRSGHQSLRILKGCRRGRSCNFAVAAWGFNSLRRYCPTEASVIGGTNRDVSGEMAKRPRQGAFRRGPWGDKPDLTLAESRAAPRCRDKTADDPPRLASDDR